MCDLFRMCVEIFFFIMFPNFSQIVVVNVRDAGGGSRARFRSFGGASRKLYKAHPTGYEGPRVVLNDLGIIGLGIQASRTVTFLGPPSLKTAQ